MAHRKQQKQACAAEIAEQYAALTCKQNKRYRTSARLTKTGDRCCYGNDNGTDGQTDRQTDRVRRNIRPPPREEGRIIMNGDVTLEVRWHRRSASKVIPPFIIFAVFDTRLIAPTNQTVGNLYLWSWYIPTANQESAYFLPRCFAVVAYGLGCTCKIHGVRIYSWMPAKLYLLNRAITLIQWRRELRADKTNVYRLHSSRGHGTQMW